MCVADCSSHRPLHFAFATFALFWLDEIHSSVGFCWVDNTTHYSQEGWLYSHSSPSTTTHNAMQFRRPEEGDLPASQNGGHFGTFISIYLESEERVLMQETRIYSFHTNNLLEWRTLCRRRRSTHGGINETEQSTHYAYAAQVLIQFNTHIS